MSRFYPYLALIIIIFAGAFFLANYTENSSKKNVLNPEYVPVNANYPEDRDDISNDQEWGDKNIYYFGYGSNMNKSSMEKRCGQENYIDLGWATLLDFRMYFYRRGAANIKPDQDFQVEGVLYKINDNCLKSLDKVEGYPSLYNRRVVPVTYQGDIAKAEVYIILNEQTTGLPSENYYNIVMTGALEHNLPASYIDYIKQIAGKSQNP